MKHMPEKEVMTPTAGAMVREELRAALIGTPAWAYQDMDSSFEKAPLPDRWLTNDPGAVFGIPAELAYLECAFYRRLPPVLARQWPERFVNAVREGADLSGVADRLMLWLLRDLESPLMLDMEVAQRLWRDKLPLAEAASLFDSKLAGDPPAPQKGDDLRSLAVEGVREEIMRNEAAVIHACGALRDMGDYLADPTAAHLPASALKSVGSAVHQLDIYSTEAALAFRRGRQYVDGPGYRYRAEYNLYGAAADALVRYIMEAPRVGG